MNIKQILDNNEIDREYTLNLQLKELFRTADGLHIFTVTDGTGTLRITTFIAGKKAYEELTDGGIYQFSFKTKLFSGKLQADLLGVQQISKELIEKTQQEIQRVLEEKYAPKDTNLLLESEAFKLLKPSMVQAATQIRKAIIEKRPIHITHHGDCDGYSAGILLEKAITALINKYHPQEKFVGQYIKRVPSKPPFYDIGDATKDANFFLSNKERFGVDMPLVIITDNGSTKQDIISIKKVKMYGADVIVIDHHDPGTIIDGKSAVCAEVLTHVNPHLLGITESLSASMLCYQVAHFINRHEQPSVTVAAIGGVDDWCQGETIDKMVAQTGLEREYLFDVGFFVNYEIYIARMNVHHGGLFTLLYGTVEERQQLIDLYKPFFEETQEGVAASMKEYGSTAQWGSKKVALFDAETTTMWGDYYTIGKVSDVAKEVFDPDVVVAYSNSMVVFRAKEESGFDTNVIIKQLQEQLPYARVSGGGHAVAGSMKFVPAAKEKILELIEAYIASL